MGMRHSLVRFRSIVHMYVNRKQYVKVRERRRQYFSLSSRRNLMKLKCPLVCLQMKLEAQRRAAEERRRREMVGVRPDGIFFYLFFFWPLVKGRHLTDYLLHTSLYMCVCLFVFYSFRS